MRAALHGLTTRGRCLIAAGLAAVICAVLLGEKDLLRVAVVLLVLPALCVVALARARFRLSCERSLSPTRTPVGEAAEVRITLRNVSVIPTSVVLVEDEVPYALGAHARFTLDQIRPGHDRELRYLVRSPLRGHFSVGPLRLQLSDPFGLVELTRSFSTSDRLTVVPGVVPLRSFPISGATGDGPGSSRRSIAARGVDEAATREYRQGDDLRKVHWKSTARTGKLMVRREERPWQARAALVVDCRVGAHRGEAPDSSFEWAVTAAASIGAHLISQGYLLTLASQAGVLEHELDSRAVLLDRLAGLDLVDDTPLTGAIPALRSAARDRTVIAVTGLLSAEHAAQLTSIRSTATSGLAIAVDAHEWTRLDPPERDAASAEFAAQLGAFADAGWHVASAGRAGSIDGAWAQLGEQVASQRRAAASAVRASLLYNAAGI